MTKAGVNESHVTACETEPHGTGSETPIRIKIDFQSCSFALCWPVLAFHDLRQVMAAPLPTILPPRRERGEGGRTSIRSGRLPTSKGFVLSL